ncbi:hypothetical protein [Fluviicola sp.]|jgi:hypothetical protein|uniref:hypothetical protein n=1 Tax=Fluviicola sp. TaxID=1917219 RepID=UPI00281C978C|nr:hypothetical protein [Fluviicola sp.]MDR0801673.1 hypothetical protein [Fluviicola sp.]
MKIIFAILLIICGATIFTFDSLELTLLESGFSWTMSKMLPYLILGFGGILLAYSFAKGFKLKPKVVKIIITILLFALPFAIGFKLHPIYQGDFSSEGTEVSGSKVSVDPKYDLVIVTIPGCPFCLESISRLKLIKKYHPKVKMLFMVCSSDKNDLKLYRTIIAGDFDIALAKDLEAAVTLAESHFPTFVHVKNGVPVYKWSNDQFGAGAIDSFTGDLK